MVLYPKTTLYDMGGSGILVLQLLMVLQELCIDWIEQLPVDATK